MKQFTKEEKEDLKLLIDHRGFKLLEKLVEDFEIDILRNLKNIDLSVDKDVQILKRNKDFLDGAETLMRTIKSQTNTIGRKDFS